MHLSTNVVLLVVGAVSFLTLRAFSFSRSSPAISLKQKQSLCPLRCPGLVLVVTIRRTPFGDLLRYRVFVHAGIGAAFFRSCTIFSPLVMAPRARVDADFPRWTGIGTSGERRFSEPLFENVIRYEPIGQHDCRNIQVAKGYR